MASLADLFRTKDTRPDSVRHPLPAEQEARFQADMTGRPEYAGWADAFQGRFGERPNLNDPQYDYRTAWRQGVVPQPYGPDNNFPHWTSEVTAAPFAQPLPLKSQDHPTEWMNEFMKRTGLDPAEIGPDQAAATQTVYSVNPRLPATPSLAEMFAR